MTRICGVWGRGATSGTTWRDGGGMPMDMLMQVVPYMMLGLWLLGCVARHELRVRGYIR